MLLLTNKLKNIIAFICLPKGNVLQLGQFLDMAPV